MHTTEVHLPRLLGDARRWFEEALLSALQEAGTAPVSPTQAAVFAALDEDGTTVSELARRMGVTRQTAHQAVHGLIGAGLLEQVPDPTSARRRLIRRTPEGARTHQQAGRVLARLEHVLGERIGHDSVAALRAALEAPWGPPPGTGPAAAPPPGSGPREGRPAH